MNQESSSSGFRIGSEDEGPDPFGRSYRNVPPRKRGTEDDRRIAKLARRLTVLSVVLPLLVAFAVAGAYVILEKRISAVRSAETEAAIQSLNAGLENIEAASRSLDERLSEMVRQQEVLKQSMDEKEAPMTEAFMVFEKTSASLREDLRTVDERLGAADEARRQMTESLERLKAEKADASRLAASEEALAALREKELASVAERVKALEETVASARIDAEAAKNAVSVLEETYARDRDAVNKSIEGARAELAGLAADYKQLKKDLVDVLSVTIDQKGLSKAIQNQEKNYRSQIQGLTRSLEAKDRAISLLQTELKSLERRVTALARNRKPLGTPKPGSFIEQNIE